ncbi:MAG: catalase, partial [Candidatus Binatota bacterium]|nr:catalase [Candidatus Binatota bacterium]
GAQAKIVAPRLGSIKSAKGKEAKPDFSLLSAASVFDAVHFPGGDKAADLDMATVLHFLNEAY